MKRSDKINIFKERERERFIVLCMDEVHRKMLSYMHG